MTQNNNPPDWTRRQLLQFGLAGMTLPLAASQLPNCQKRNLLVMESSKQVDSRATEGQLLSRPTRPTTTALTGLHPLGLDGQRDGFVYVPETYRADQSAPLILILHGAGGDAEGALKILYHLAIRFGTILLAVDSRQQTWDIIRGGYGPDIAFIERALAQTFSHYVINPNQVAIAGFSDGASYALSVGITNGDLFNHIIAFSPGFMVLARQSGKPHIFISHGKSDQVLPIERCSRRIVPQLKQAGYDLEYREFNGLHTVPTAIAERAMEWFTQSAPDKTFHL
ncbi:alpha/beta hydrolase-fold protein [Nostoc sp. FACHB-888]|uniref:alpha/beta hydrolase n=1 Tax=Nostoc sp. FACHB-888 TaxID=2692842 RepID=UPI001F554E58|nr:alpha/beta hydrolase-fold protein [Nostoc sp. FACHB-888]